MPGAHMWLGVCMIRDGRAADALAKFELAFRLRPHSPNNASRFRTIAFALIFLERYEEAISWLRKSLAANPTQSAEASGNVHAAIAAAQALTGQTGEARLTGGEAVRLWPTLTARGYYRGYYRLDITNPTYAEQVARLREGLRLAGIRDHADEYSDSGVLSDDVLHTDYEALTPTAVPGALTVHTSDLATLVEQQKLLILDTGHAGMSIAGAVGLWGAGIGGSVTDENQDRLGRYMNQLLRSVRDMPIVTVGWNAERFQGRNLALRLVNLGYTKVHWYRGGREAWEVAALPNTELVIEDW